MAKEQGIEMEGGGEGTEPLTGGEVNPSQIKFVPEGASGDGPPDGDLIKKKVPSRVGLSKEELIKYSKDPFWNRIRKLLFVLFWVLWFAMLIGAVTIVAVSPHCPVKPTLAPNATDAVANQGSS